MVVEHEEKIAYNAVGNGDDFFEGFKDGKADEHTQLMRELMGRLVRLVEFKKIEGHLSGGDRVEKIVRDAQMPPAEVLSASD